MQELEKGRLLAMTGIEADNAQERYFQQMKLWGITPPAADPLILDFGLNDFKKVGLVESWIANEDAFGYCGKLLYVEAGQTCPRHRHKCKHETFFILKGSVLMDYNGDMREMKEGDILPVELWKYHSFTGKERSLLLEVSQPCEIDDNYFEDSRIPIGGNCALSQLN